MTSKSNYFTQLYQVDLKDKLETVSHKYRDRQGRERTLSLTYVSWSDALAELCKRHPDAEVEVITFDDGSGAKVPWCRAPLGYLVQVAVTVGGVRRAPFLPVMDHRHQAIEHPTARDIGDAHMRCLAKAIAMHGLGLYVYAGEDLPEASPAPPMASRRQAERLVELCASRGIKGGARILQAVSEAAGRELRRIGELSAEEAEGIIGRLEVELTTTEPEEDLGVARDRA